MRERKRERESEREKERERDRERETERDRENIFQPVWTWTPAKAWTGWFVSVL